ncbi:Short C-terminal domain-containing protein [Halomicrobium zhouii]|uniref:Short C-terminal domain-containing protein n=1 Tax=Halomicrobium zhouii TaxID=767519 RepID=A0A1I6LPT6_9EURY|nr:SHOCT domain-containing protein [Halomicrobium zhouii]SFS05517.1 Short C-terminal domain-containing protein [Halomicrobium zhouii]
MRRIVERYGPSSPRGRAVASAVFGSIGFTALFVVLAHLFAVQFQFTESASFLLALTVGLAFTTLAYWEADAVVGRAEAAPEHPRESAREIGYGQASADGDADPVADLQHRYARGELSTEEFEERVERLVETDTRVEESDVRDLELDRA